MGRRRVQRVGRSRRVVLSVRCDEPCRIGVSARAAWRRGRRQARVPTTAVRAALAAGERRRVVLRLSRRRAVAVRRALRAGHRVLVHVNVAARDAAGNRATARRAIRLR